MSFYDKIIEHQKMKSFVPLSYGFGVTLCNSRIHKSPHTAESINLQLLYSKTTDQFLVLALWEKKTIALCQKRPGN